jgi:16S rRNA processing protein RimM
LTQAEVLIGRIVGTFGLRGHVKIAGADADEVRAGAQLEGVAADGRRREYVIVSVRVHKRVLVASLKGITDVSEAEKLVGTQLYVEAASLPALPEGVHRASDLVGMQVIDKRLGPLGEVRSVAHYPSADMLVVGDGLIPMHQAYDVAIDLGARKITLTLPDGFDEIMKPPRAKRESQH